MLHSRTKQLILLLGLLLPTAWCGANAANSTEGHSHIQIKEATVQSHPKGYAIQASICGHALTVVFSENIGPVAVEITTASGVTVQTLWVA